MNFIIKKAMIDTLSVVIITKNAASALTDKLKSPESHESLESLHY
jgi:hypothetical protein